MRGIAIALVSACLLAFAPAAAAEAKASEGVCAISGGQASLSVTYVRNPVPFGKVDAAVLVGHTQPELEGSGCGPVTGTFNEYSCVPDGAASCSAPMGATTVTMFTSIPIDVTVTVNGLTPSGQLVQATASCSMTFQAFLPPRSCDLT